jgi:hypothetical protein
MKRFLIEWAPVASALASVTTAVVALRLGSWIKRPSLDLTDDEYLVMRTALCRRIAQGSRLARIQLAINDWRQGWK